MISAVMSNDSLIKASASIALSMNVAIIVLETLGKRARALNAA